MTKVTVVNSPGIRSSDALSELTKVPEITAYGSIYGGRSRRLPRDSMLSGSWLQALTLRFVSVTRAFRFRAQVLVVYL